MAKDKKNVKMAAARKSQLRHNNPATKKPNKPSTKKPKATGRKKDLVKSRV